MGESARVRMSDAEFEAQCGPLRRAPVYAEAKRARASEAALIEGLNAVAFELGAGGELICRRCRKTKATHSPTFCEVAAALAQAEGH